MLRLLSVPLARCFRFRGSTLDQGPSKGRPGRLSGDPLAQQDPVARRNAEKFGDAPDRVFLEFIDHAVGKRDVPQHFHDFLASIVVERAFQDAGEMVEIDGLAVALLAHRD